MKIILSYQDFISDSLKESLDPYIQSNNKFKIGDPVKVKDRLGKITAFNGKEYLVLIGSKNERFPENQIEPVIPTKSKTKITPRKKLPRQKNLKI